MLHQGKDYTKIIRPLPLHDSETLFPPSEAAATAQTEAPGAAVDGWSALVPLNNVLQRYGGGSHSQSGAWDDRNDPVSAVQL